MTKTSNSTTYTYQTRFEVDSEVDEKLSLYAQLLSRASRSLFAWVMSGKEILSAKKEFMQRFEITARQFNACRVTMEAKIVSIRQINEQRIKDLKQCIKNAKEKIAKLSRKKRELPKLWYHKQRLLRLQTKLKKLEEQQASGKVSLCFGSQKLFRSQFHGDQSHKEWKEQWDQQRNREFFTLGSKDETAGNQTCTATVGDDGLINLRLRLPNGLNSGKYLEISGLHFNHGHEAIIAALKSCQKRNELLKAKDPNYKSYGQAISYRFVKDKKGWRVFASTSVEMIEKVTNQQRGMIGIDMNADHLAVAETDRNGNFVVAKTIPCVLYGKTKEQAQAIIGDACAQLVEMAVKAKKPLVLEQLDFSKKKLILRGMQSKLARMLSSFSYNKIIQTIRSRSLRNGVEVFNVNPAFTSLIGRIKFAARYGLTTHHAAALCVARRYLRFSESLPLQSSVPDGKGGHIAFSVPVRNQEKHEWQFLKKVAKKLQAALAERFRVVKNQSTTLLNDRSCDEKSSNSIGAIPIRESLATLLG